MASLPKDATFFDRHPLLVLGGVPALIVFVAAIFGWASIVGFVLLGLFFAVIFVLIGFGITQSFTRARRISGLQRKRAKDVSQGYQLFSVDRPVTLGRSVVDNKPYALQRLTLNQYVGPNNTRRYLIKTLVSTIPNSFLRVPLGPERPVCFVALEDARIDGLTTRVSIASLELRQRLVNQGWFDEQVLEGDRWDMVEEIIPTDRALTITGLVIPMRSNQLPGTTSWLKGLYQDKEGKTRQAREVAWRAFELSRDERRVWREHMRRLENIEPSQKLTGTHDVLLVTPDFRKRRHLPLILTITNASDVGVKQFGDVLWFLGILLLALFFTAAIVWHSVPEVASYISETMRSK